MLNYLHCAALVKERHPSMFTHATEMCCEVCIHLKVCRLQGRQPYAIPVSTFSYKWLKWLSREVLKMTNHKSVIYSLKDVCVCVYVLFFFCCPGVLGRLAALCETWVFFCFTSQRAQVGSHKEQWPNFIGSHPVCPNDLKLMQGNSLVFLGSCRYFAHMSKTSAPSGTHAAP